MRIIRFLDETGNVFYGTDMANGEAVVLEGELFGEMKRTGRTVRIKTLLSPVMPSAVLCVGLNYREHFEEAGMQHPKYPVLFMKNPASITGHNSEIIIPASCKNPYEVDYEAELAVVIGKAAKSVSERDALDYVAGYTIANDVSARTWQLEGGGRQWIRGKSFDTFCPLGPELVMADEGVNPDSLKIELRLNGQMMQRGHTSDMIFPIARIISFLSEDTTLLPGTVILTGTPSGVGFTRTPPVFLRPGDRIEIDIENLGTLVNTVR